MGDQPGPPTPHPWSQEAVDEFRRRALDSLRVQNREESVINSPSWGAAIFSPLYLAEMHAWGHAGIAVLLGILSTTRILDWFFPALGMIFWGYCALYGKRIAWTTRQWRGFEDFLDCQQIWDKWGKAGFVVLLVVLGGAILQLTIQTR